jgi:hypothetical protein
MMVFIISPFLYYSPHTSCCSGMVQLGRSSSMMWARSRMMRFRSCCVLCFVFWIKHSTCRDKSSIRF